jgi:hypothetical protein
MRAMALKNQNISQNEMAEMKFEISAKAEDIG